MLHFDHTLVSEGSLTTQRASQTQQKVSVINYCHFKNIRKASRRLPFPSPYSSPLASSEENTTH